MKKTITALAAMTLAGLSIWFSLWVLNSVIIAFLMYYCLVCVGLPLAAALAGGTGIASLPASLGMKRPSRPDILWGLGSGLAICAFMLAAFGLMGDFLMGGNRILETLEAWGFSRRYIVLVYLVMIVFNGAVEEIFWRGFVHGLLAGLVKRPLALAIASLPFGLFHIFVISSIFATPLAAALVICGITVGGFFWAFLREWRGNLWPSLISHVLVTLGYLGVFSLFIFGS